MKIITLLALAGASVVAHASYELMLLPDTATHSILRYDPITGTSLGSFGGLYLAGGVDAVIADPTTGRAYVHDVVSNKISAFNYSTGEFIKSIPVPGTAATWAGAFSRINGGGGFIFSSYGSNAYRYDANMNLKATYSVPSGQSGVGSVAMAQDGFVYAVSNPGNNVLRYAYAGGGAVANSSSIPGSNFSLQLVFQGNTGLTIQANVNKMYRVDAGSPPTYSLLKDLGSAYFAYSLAYGHGNLAYISSFRNSDSKYVIHAIDTSDGSGLQDFVVPGGYRGIDVIVAPEPAGLTATAIGLVALIGLRRRKG